MEKFYGINATYIRPNDPLKKFFDVDSFKLDAGTEKFEEWLKNNFEFPNFFSPPKTILDLLIFLEKTGPKIEKEK